MNYFDNASTTKVASRVLEAESHYFSEIYCNASSNHEFGKIAKNAIELARVEFSELMNRNNSKIIHTSMSTDSINLTNLVLPVTQANAPQNQKS
jgi:cysteine desulfurase